jgi:hypothetical protein
VDIRGSVHILGTGLTSADYAIDLGGTAELVGNNYTGLDSALLAKVPALPTVIHNGETVQTLNSELRVKRGIVGLSGSATAGEPDFTGNAFKETIDGSYVTDGFGGNQGTLNVYSDNGWSNGYDLGDAIAFPSLNDPFQGYSSYYTYFNDTNNALVISNQTELDVLANITPNSSFDFNSGNGRIAMDGNGNLTVTGKVYINGGGIQMSTAGSNKTITYNGKAAILATGDVQIDVNLVTNGNASFPNSVVGIMTPGIIGFDEAGINVMGLFYGEDRIIVQKQTDIMGTIVANYFDMGTNVPAIFQVPDTSNNLPVGMIGGDSGWVMKVVSWQKV